MRLFSFYIKVRLGSVSVSATKLCALWHLNFYKEKLSENVPLYVYVVIIKYKAFSSFKYLWNC